MTEQPVFSARDVESFTPPGSPRTYLIAPLTYRQRVAFRADLAKAAGTYPSDGQMLAGLREAVRQASPGNAEDLVAVIDAAEAAPADTSAQAGLAVIEAACASAPAYGGLLAARARFTGMLPFFAAKHALRGWEGEGLPPFAQKLGVVPDELLDQLPELEAVGWRANVLMSPGTAAVGNSGSRSPSRANRRPATGASSRKTAGAGASRAKSTKPTPG